MLLHPPPAVQFKLPGGHGATETPPGSHDAHHDARHAKKQMPVVQYYGSFKGPEMVADSSRMAALNADTRQHHAEDFLVSLILIAIVLFAAAMASFFWRKYRSFHLRTSPSTYEYSQLSQCERERADLSEIADDLGISISTSTDEEELEPACPATISVTASYITNIATNNSINNNNDGDSGKLCLDHHEPPDDDLLDMTVTPDADLALAPQLQAPLQPEAWPEAPPALVAFADAPRLTTVFVDSDEELLQ